ncbi:MAG: glycoside hydrolase family 19 protein [Cytophagales bacterium]|nr:glycoside hydrolase family 19 protein [Cytophagales bacterium]
MKKYTIQPGDTLGTIAKKFYGNASKYTEIAEANDISNPNVVKVGQELVLPGIEDNEADKPAAAPAPSAPTPEEPATPATGDGFFTAATLAEIMPKASQVNIDKYLGALNGEMSKFDINTPLRAAHFIAQLAHESGSFHYSSENLNYSASALRAVFGKYFPTDEEAEAYARQPEKIANRVYANRMGNGDESSGEGWKYRGRGLIQLTGKDNYTNCGNATGMDLVNNPDQLADNADAAVAAAGWFWDMRKLNGYADQDDIKAITKRINGGYNGLEDREAYLARAKQVLGIS